MNPSTNRILSCRCGKVQLELSGSPMLASICHCDDCQMGSAQIERLPGAPKILDAWGGTPYVLYRKDRIRLLRGHEHLTKLIIKDDQKTERVVASCCNSPLFVDFRPGHWISFYQQAFDPPAPQALLRAQTRFMPAGELPDDGLPLYRAYPLRMIVKLLSSRLAMGLKRPSTNW